MSVSNASFAFRDGGLYLINAGSEIRLQWTPKPIAEMRLPRGQWQPYRPEFRIIAPITPIPSELEGEEKTRLFAKYEAFHAFRRELPDAIIEAVEPFACHQWLLMTFLRDSTSGLDLVRSNPVLAYALANNDQIRATSTHATPLNALRYGSRKQRDILGWLDFPNTEAMARILKKIPLSIVYPGLIRKVRQCCKSPEILKCFGHLPSLNTGVIFLASQAEMATLVTPKLLQEVADAPDEALAAPTADLLAEVISLASEMHMLDALHPVSSFRKMQELRDNLARKYLAFMERKRQQQEARAARALLTAQEDRAARAERATAVVMDAPPVRPPRVRRPLVTQPAEPVQPSYEDPFPAPPIPGTDKIIPLTTFTELKHESSVQRNCVGLTSDYARRVRAGTLYVYKVLAEERHTLSMVKYGNNCWSIGELKRYCNAMGTKEAYNLVVSWRDARQVSL
jgi:hypothetical protein